MINMHWSGVKGHAFMEPEANRAVGRGQQSI